jgi:hypothetical protein
MHEAASTFKLKQQNLIEEHTGTEVFAQTMFQGLQRRKPFLLVVE